MQSTIIAGGGYFYLVWQWKAENLRKSQAGFYHTGKSQ
jgi:hypothetical protein